jgi:hypothetical protein
MKHLRQEDELLLGKARRGIEPAEADRARIKRKLFAQIGLGVGAATSAVAGSANATAGSALAGGTGLVAHAGGLALGVKALAALVVVGAVGAGFVVTSRFPSAGSRRSAPMAVVSPSASLGPAQALTHVVETPSGATAGGRALDAPISNPPSNAAEGPATPPPPGGDHAAESSLSLGGGALVPSRQAPSASVPARGAVTSPARGGAPSLTASAPDPAPASPPAVPPVLAPSSVAEEADLLRRADLTLKANDPEGALALLDRHAAQFPRGVLVEERDAERVVVLCALSRVDDARALAATFLRDRPRSPLAVRVRASCATP